MREGGRWERTDWTGNELRGRNQLGPLSALPSLSVPFVFVPLLILSLSLCPD